MGHEIALANAHPDSAIRVFRNAPATTGADGEWVQLVFDSESTKIQASDIELVDGYIVPRRSMNVALTARSCVDNVPGLSRYYLRVVVEEWDEQTESYADREHVTLFSDATSSGHAINATTYPRVMYGDRVRVDVRSDGVANVPLNVGDSTAWAEMRHV